MKVKECKEGLISLEVPLIEYRKAYVMSQIVGYISTWKCLGQQLMADLLLTQ